MIDSVQVASGIKLFNSTFCWVLLLLIFKAARDEGDGGGQVDGSGGRNFIQDLGSFLIAEYNQLL